MEEEDINIPVPLLVSPNLGHPEPPVHVRNMAAFRAPVPETAIEKYRDPALREVEVGLAFDRGCVERPTPDSRTHQKRPESGFGGPVAATSNCCHVSRTCLGHILEFSAR
jgi:hypothetical protein